MNNIKNSISFLKKDSIELIEGISTHSFPIHTHQIFCVGIVTRGNLRFIINNQEYSLRENSIYLVPPGKSHSINADNHHQYSYLAICIRNLFPQTDFRNYTREDQTAADKIMQYLSCHSQIQR